MHGATPGDLQQALDSFCPVRRAPSGGALKLAQFQRYLGLVLSGNTAGIDWLAAECVTHFDRFRAPLDEWDRGRVADGRLTSEEMTFMETFGYPYVLSAFEFHISLAGPLRPEELSEVAYALEPHLLKFMTGPMSIPALSLLGEREREGEGGGTFEVISRHRFRWANR